MKDLKGFLNEDEDKKKKPKPKSEAPKSGEKKKKKKERKEKGGKDDERYISLMDEYKRMRHHNRLEANALHNKALHLRHHGDVSKRACTAAAYI